MSGKTSTDNPYLAFDMMTTPFIIGRAAFEMAMASTVSLARVAQIAAQSADTALAKYIQLTEEEMKRSQRKESVKIE
jgi:hypothetical protein